MADNSAIGEARVLEPKPRKEDDPVPQVGEFVSVEYPEIDKDVWYEFGEFCGRVIERKNDHLRIFFPFQDAPPETVWLEPLTSPAGQRWKDRSTPAIVQLRPATAEQANETFDLISEARWTKLLKKEEATR